MSVIFCFRFLGVEDGDLCPSFGVVLNADRSSCGELTTTPFHNFTRPPFTSWRTFTASPSLKDDGQSGSDICCPLTSTMSCRRSSQTLPSYRLLSLPTHCTGIRSIRDDQMAVQTETQVLVRRYGRCSSSARNSSLALCASTATASAPPPACPFRFSAASASAQLPLQRHFHFSAAAVSAPLPRRLSPPRSCRAERRDAALAEVKRTAADGTRTTDWKQPVVVARLSPYTVPVTLKDHVHIVALNLHIKQRS